MFTGMRPERKFAAVYSAPPSMACPVGICDSGVLRDSGVSSEDEIICLWSVFEHGAGTDDV